MITGTTRNSLSSHSAFSQRQFDAGTYRNSTCIATESTPHSYRTTLGCVKRHYVMKPICES